MRGSEFSSEKVYAQQGRLSALPSEMDFIDLLCGDVLLNVSFEHLGSHFLTPVIGIKVLLFEVEAVFAIEVANRPNGFGHDVKGGGWHERSRWTPMIRADAVARGKCLTAYSSGEYPFQLSHPEESLKNRSTRNWETAHRREYWKRAEQC